MKYSADRLSAEPVLIGKEISAGLMDAISDDNPLPVRQTLPPVDNVQRYVYSGTVSANSSATLHGGASGTPTIVGCIYGKQIIVALQQRSGAAQTGNSLRVRRRYLATDGSPYTVWTDYVSFSFDSDTTDKTNVFVIASSNDANNPLADEFEISIQNASTTASITWQAIVAVIK